jgi:hypothetical protein
MRGWAELEEFGWGLVFGDGGGTTGLHRERGCWEEKEWRVGRGRACVNEGRR